MQINKYILIVRYINVTSNDDMLTRIKKLIKYYRNK